MRYFCYLCGKSVTSELSHESIIRAVLICPECIGGNKVIFPEREHETPETKDPSKTEE